MGMVQCACPRFQVHTSLIHSTHQNARGQCTAICSSILLKKSCFNSIPAMNQNFHALTTVCSMHQNFDASTLFAQSINIKVERLDTTKDTKVCVSLGVEQVLVMGWLFYVNCFSFCKTLQRPKSSGKLSFEIQCVWLKRKVFAFKYKNFTREGACIKYKTFPSFVFLITDYFLWRTNDRLIAHKIFQVEIFSVSAYLICALHVSDPLWWPI